VLGFGMAISIAPLTTTVMNAVDEQLAGTASGVNNAVSRTAGLLSIAVFGIVILQTFAHRFEEALRKIPLPPGTSSSLIAQRFNLAGVNIPANLDSTTQDAVRQAIDASFVAGFRELMLISAALAVLSAVAAALLIRSSNRQTPKS
jgi:hypothetical protein